MRDESQQNHQNQRVGEAVNEKLPFSRDLFRLYGLVLIKGLYVVVLLEDISFRVLLVSNEQEAGHVNGA